MATVLCVAILLLASICYSAFVTLTLMLKHEKEKKPQNLAESLNLVFQNLGPWINTRRC